MVCLRNEQRSFCYVFIIIIIIITPKYCILYSFVDYEGYSNFSKGFFPTVVDIMVIWTKFTHSSPLYFTDFKNVSVHSCHLPLATSNLTCFMDQTFQVPMQYCSLQHQFLLASSVTSTLGIIFLFGSVSSFFLELFLHSYPIVYWAPTDLGSSSFSVISFCLFILFMGFSR